MAIDQQQENDLNALIDGEFVPSEQDLAAGQDSPKVTEVSTGELCTGCFQLAFSVMASRKGEHWALKQEEAEALGNSFGAVLDKYWPGLDLGPEVALLGAAAMVMMPRIAEDKKQEAARAKEQDAGVPNGDQS